MTTTITVNANISWVVGRDLRAQVWVGWCNQLKLTAQADSFGEMLETINEIMTTMMETLLEEGQLEAFLRRHGWGLAQPVPAAPAGDVGFDVPFSIDRAEPVAV